MGLRNLAVLACLGVLAACWADETQTDTPDGIPLGTGFDHYVLALSWSPGYCRSQGDRANRQQCRAAEPFGFVVHGLWPQFTDGWPEFCESDQPLSVNRSVSDSMEDIMPSRGLIAHQRKKHGTCSGLEQSDYFNVTRAAFDRIVIPDEFQDRDTISTIDPMSVETAFRQSNPAIAADAIAVTCDRRFLRDVRICMTNSLDGYVSCPQVDRRDCQLDSVVVPPN